MEMRLAFEYTLETLQAKRHLVVGTLFVVVVSSIVYSLRKFSQRRRFISARALAGKDPSENGVGRNVDHCPPPRTGAEVSFRKSSESSVDQPKLANKLDSAQLGQIIDFVDKHKLITAMETLCELDLFDSYSETLNLEHLAQGTPVPLAAFNYFLTSEQRQRCLMLQLDCSTPGEFLRQIEPKLHWTLAKREKALIIADLSSGRTSLAEYLNSKDVSIDTVVEPEIFWGVDVAPSFAKSDQITDSTKGLLRSRVNELFSRYQTIFIADGEGASTPISQQLGFGPTHHKLFTAALERLEHETQI